MSHRPLLSVVISQYNELLNLKNGAIEKMYSYLEKQTYSWELIIVDDGSTDGSTNYTSNFERPNFKYIKAPHSGKAGGLFTGIKEASGQWILLTDIDQSTPLNQVEKLMLYTSEYDAIIGSRGIRRENSSIIRKLASVIFRTFRKVLLLHNIEDTQCGFKLFNSEVLKRVFPHLDVIKSFEPTGWNVTAFDVELLFMFEKLNRKIKEVPVDWKDEDLSDSKDRQFVKESTDMIKQILKVVKNNFLGRYKNI